YEQVKSVDWISKLPNDVLLMILSRLCTKEAVGTSVVSKRWEHVWKQVSHLVFDKPKTINSTELHDGSNPDDTLITKVEVFNTLISSCPSLEVLVLYITCTHDIGGPLKIENNKLKLLHVLFMDNIGGLQVSSTSLNILVILNTSFGNDDFFLCSPKLQFSKNFFAPHISYNISKEEKSIVHEEFVNNISGGLCKPIALMAASMSVSINLMNRTEVERLRQVLVLWIRKMRVLEITFKDNNNALNESWEKKLWEEDNKNNVAFPNAKFRVKTLWMPNFSGSEEEFAFASCLIKHGTVVDEMMIKTSSFSARKKLEIEAAVNKLRALQTEEDQLTIKCF
ncbi:unnamed protein product, partial [Brassica oleracea]